MDAYDIATEIEFLWRDLVRGRNTSGVLDRVPKVPIFVEGKRVIKVSHDDNGIVLELE
jgi:hypothetical protein